MNYTKFKEIIEGTPLLTDDYKYNLLTTAINYSSELLEKIINIVSTNELKFIDDVNNMKKQKQNELKENIENEETKEKIEAEQEIDKLLNLNF